MLITASVGCYLRQAQRAVKTILFTEHIVKYSVMLGVLLLTQHFFYQKVI